MSSEYKESMKNFYIVCLDRGVEVHKIEASSIDDAWDICQESYASNGGAEFVLSEKNFKSLKTQIQKIS